MKEHPNFEVVPEWVGSKPGENRSTNSTPNESRVFRDLRFLFVVFALLMSSLAISLPASAATKYSHPSAPRYLRAVPGNESMTVLFAPPASSGGYRVSRYVVDVHPANLNYTCRASDCSLGRLKDGVTYFFTVAAVNKLGRGPFSGRSNEVTPHSPAPTSATVTFNANGCSGAMASETATLNSSAALSANTFSCAGFNFTGWNTAANGSGAIYANNALYLFAASITLYAQWTATPATIPFSGTNSSNWSGYVFRAPAIITYASGRWTVPTMNCAGTPNGDSATWVGIGGAGGSSGALLQTGTTDNCVNGVQEDSGWWEIVPANPNSEETYLNFTVNPGDQIVAEVYQNSAGQWETVLQDLTSGLQGVMQTSGSWYVSTIATNILIGGVQGDASGYQYAGGYSAEWITEDPSGSTTGAFYPFANYGSVTFTNLETNVSPWSLPNSDAFEIVQNDVTLSVPGAVSGSGFTVSYTGP